MKKSLVILLFILLTLLTVHFGSASNPKITIYVDDDALCPGDGSQEWPYCKIQYAIDNASEKDTIYVYSGTYNENIIINKSSIILQGENRETTIVKGGNNEWWTIGLFGNNIVITNFTIDSTLDQEISKAGIHLSSTMNCILLNNIIRHHNWGIYLDNTEKNVIDGNQLLNNHYGIFNWQSKTIIKNNHVLHNDIGIILGATWSCEIFQNSCMNNIYGIKLEPGMSQTTGMNRLYWNDIANNTFGISFITVDFGWIGDNNITENRIRDNDYGIYFSSFVIGVIDNSIYKNSITGNEVGIILNHSNKNVIQSNNFIKNKKSASFFSCENKTWNGNYWNRPRLFPKFIYGKTMIQNKETPWLNIDWNPAKEPYNVGDWV